MNDNTQPEPTPRLSVVDTNVKPFTAKGQQEIINDLKDLLKEAENGEITGLLVAYERPDGKVGTLVVGLENMFATVGYLQRMIHRIMSKVDEQAQEL